jgi:hypothetical protein
MAAQSTYTPIATYTASGSVASYAFTNIPQTYTDLIIVANARTAYAGQTAWGISAWFNNISTTNWSGTALYGNGSSASSSRSTTSTPTYSIGINYPAANATTGIFGSTVIHVNNYSNTSTYKTVLVRNAWDLNGSGNAELFAFLWQNTSAITEFDLGASANFVAGSTWTIYGIKAA